MIMGAKRLILLGMVVLLIVNLSQSEEIPEMSKFNSSVFPDGFIWGTATSAYQTEGGLDKRGINIWDTFSHNYPGRIDDGSNGDVATDFYKFYKNDTEDMNKQLGMNGFRFSISWARVIPTGNISEGVSEEGIEFYDRVIDEIIKNGMEPFATLFHWDVPEALEVKYGGFRSPKIVSDFEDFAALCFKRFNNKVKHWITFNEPHIFTVFGYDTGSLAPGRCSSWVNKACAAGNSGTEPYKVAHHLLLAHAKAVQQYRKLNTVGKIGITLDVTFGVPYSGSEADRNATSRYLDFIFGWFMEPITHGHYPRVMRNLVGNRLPIITDEDSQLLKGSYDFVGLNYYTSNYVSDILSPKPVPDHFRYTTDMQVSLTTYNKEGKPIGEQASPSWLYVVPEGIKNLLNYTKNVYEDPIIYITENGVGDNSTFPPEEALKDLWRIKYHRSHLWNVFRAICEDKVRVKGYFAWSFIDNFEWASGYTVRMGLYATDTNNKLMRTPKLSVGWFNQFLKDKNSTAGPKCPLRLLQNQDKQEF
ncbi:beta-glucosidase 13-like [Mercurialis annua]|uniref:beta-glucosidase 13-like n=1 Tax=Mercurialis annua TaxID=3986 RepID=UPI0021601ED2|nr:beta-glucosidase 13-like [Mercurialis annua]